MKLKSAKYAFLLFPFFWIISIILTQYRIQGVTIGIGILARPTKFQSNLFRTSPVRPKSNPIPIGIRFQLENLNPNSNLERRVQLEFHQFGIQFRLKYRFKLESYTSESGKSRNKTSKIPRTNTNHTKIETRCYIYFIKLLFIIYSH